MKLPTGFHVLHVPIPDNPLGFLLAYLIEGEEGHTLIDAGWNVPEAYQSLVEQLAALGMQVKDICQIILTHMHPDHCGLADQLRRESGAKVLCHQTEAGMRQRLDREVQAAMQGAWTSRFESCGVPPQVLENTRFHRGRYRHLSWPEPDGVLRGGEVIAAGNSKLEVIWTPGHAPGHICLYDRKNKVLFSGDHILPVTTPNVSLLSNPYGAQDPLGDYLDSLEKVRPLEVSTVLPAHDHVFHDLPGRLSEIEQHHQARLREMQESADTGWVTPFEAAQKVTWAIGTFDSLENTHKIMAVGETLAHLEFLQKRGRVEKKVENGLMLYHNIG